MTPVGKDPSSPAGTADYSTVTETWGLPASPEQVAMQNFRYKKSGDLGDGKRVLEVGCGAGMGLAYLLKRSRLVVGGDYTLGLLKEARAHLPSAPLARFDAQHLPFDDATFDVVLLLEMVYYVPDLDQALRECRRVLAPGGTVFVCMPNRDRPDFNPSPFAIKYPNVRDIAELLEKHGFAARVMGGFPVEAESSRDRALRPIREFAVQHHLIPGNMWAKGMIKRVLYGSRSKLGAVDDANESYPDWVELDPAGGPHRGFKTLYAIGEQR